MRINRILPVPLRPFLLCHLLIVLAFSNVATMLGAHYARRCLLQQEAALVQQLVHGAATAADVEGYFKGGVDNWALEYLFSHVVRLPGVVGLDVTTHDGTIRWSSRTQRREASPTAPTETSTPIASVGVPKSWFAQSPVELLIPIGNGRRIVGALELVRFPGSINRAIARLLPMLWATALFGTLLFYGLLLSLRLKVMDSAPSKLAGTTAPGVRVGVDDLDSTVAPELRKLPQDALRQLHRRRREVSGWPPVPVPVLALFLGLAVSSTLLLYIAGLMETAGSEWVRAAVLQTLIALREI